MATESMIEGACRTDEELAKRGVSRSPVSAPHLLPDVEEEVDPAEQARIARWFRRSGLPWLDLADMLDLPKGGPLTPWPADLEDRDAMAVCLSEARQDQVVTVAALEAAKAAAAEEVKAERRPKPAARPRAPRPLEWVEAAACQGKPLLLFFGTEGERAADRQVREAYAQMTCRACPVRTQCLDWAIGKPERAGVWGGLGEEGRASERRRRMRRAAEQATRPTLVAAEKRCLGCQETKPADKYGKDRRRPDGLNAYCKPCTNELARTRRSAEQVAS